MKETWVILGATSAIAREFAHFVAAQGHALLLIGRDNSELEILSANYRLRYHILCETMSCDFAMEIPKLCALLDKRQDTFFLFIAYSQIINNAQLTPTAITQLIDVNVRSTAELIAFYQAKKQAEHRLIFLSSVAAARGRAKNSLYGASKAAIEVYLQGLQQNAGKNENYTIVRLGFIDTVQTFGEKGIFYAASPQDCARACFKAVMANKRFIYFPFFWRYIIFIIKKLPFFLYKKLSI